jgi:hypothetical protein
MNGRMRDGNRAIDLASVGKFAEHVQVYKGIRSLCYLFDHHEIVAAHPPRITKAVTLNVY